MENKITELADCLEQEDYSIKIVVVGDSGVGKSNILTRYVQNEFNQNSKATVGVELSTKTYKINDKIIKLHLWDTAGQERYKSITSAYYRGAKGAMIVYDITRTETFNNVDKWFNEIREYGDKNVVMMVAGNKTDLTNLRSVDIKSAQDKSAVLGIPAMETSAFSSQNIDAAFKLLINGNSLLN
jgi:Ras-related protein Rab-11A